MKLLALDLSTSNSGYAIFDVKTKKLLKSGQIKPKIKGISKMRYPQNAFHKCLSIAAQIGDLYEEVQPDLIVIEEVNRGINRIAQKSLDSLHFFVLQACFCDDLFDKLNYIDSNGAKGWRGKLKLTIAKKYPHLKGASIKWKKAAEEFVNEKFKTEFDVVERKRDADEVDAIALGYAFVKDFKK